MTHFVRVLCKKTSNMYVYTIKLFGHYFLLTIFSTIWKLHAFLSCTRNIFGVALHVWCIFYWVQFFKEKIFQNTYAKLIKIQKRGHKNIE